MKRGEILKPTEIFFDDQVFRVPEGWEWPEILQKAGYWEPDVSAWLLGNLKPETVFVDIGAQLGYYTLMAAKRAALVFAFEPRADMREYLKANVDRNGHRNVTISEFALYSKETEGYMGRDLGDGTGMQWAMFREGKPPEGFEAARTTTLDAYLEGRKVDLVKIDVEGGEYEVLLGMAETARRHAPTLVIEVHPLLMEFYGRQSSDLARLLGQWGYRCRKAAASGGDPDWENRSNKHIIAWR
jgi:FkbM family methyltransferase